jgi:hypothetical protein
MPRVKKVKEISKDTIDKYFLENSAVITVPDKVVKMDNGFPQLIDTLTKTGNFKKIKGNSVIKVKSGETGLIKVKQGDSLSDKSNTLLLEIKKESLKKLNNYENKLIKEKDDLKNKIKDSNKNEKIIINKKIKEIEDLLYKNKEVKSKPHREFWQLMNKLPDKIKNKIKY